MKRKEKGKKRKRAGGKKEQKERKGGGRKRKKGKKEEGGRWVEGVRGAWVLRRVRPHTNNARWFQFFITCNSTNNANNATHYVKLVKKRRESSKRDHYFISPRVKIIKAIVTI